MKTLFICKASPTLGSGHVMRCLTLANALYAKGWECTFFCSAETVETVPLLRSAPHNLVYDKGDLDHYQTAIIDRYDFDKADEAPFRAYADKIVVIDDLADRAHECDVLLDQTYGRQKQDYESLVPDFCEFLLGADYALLRPEFPIARQEALSRREKRNGKLERILVSLGGTNIDNITGKVLSAFLDYNRHNLKIDVVMGGSASFQPDVEVLIEELNTKSLHSVTLFRNVDSEKMVALMVNADLSIGAGGTTSWERCCLGLPTVLIELADNQKDIARDLDRAGAVINLGTHKNLSREALTSTLNDLVSQPETLMSMTEKAASICNGHGLERVIPRLVLPEEKVSLSVMDKHDEKILYEWQSSEGLRKYFRNSDAPSWEEHQTWFKKAVEDQKRQLFCIRHGRDKAGMLRLDSMEDFHEYEISILVAPGFQGKKIASYALKQINKIYPEAVFYAEIHPENKASLRLFENAHYQKVTQTLYKLSGKNYERKKLYSCDH